MSGMIGTVDWRDAPGSREIIRDSYREQAELLAEAGVDLLLEMTQDVEVGVAAIEAAKGTGLPVWVAFSCNFMKALARLLAEEDLSDVKARWGRAAVRELT